MVLVGQRKPEAGRVEPSTVALDPPETGGTAGATSLIVIAAVIARQQGAVAAWRDLTRAPACGLRSALPGLPGTLHATCHLSTFAVPRSHAALSPRPDFTCIARTSRHATPETAVPALHLPAWPAKTDASSVVNGTRLEIQ